MHDGMDARALCETVGSGCVTRLTMFPASQNFLLWKTFGNLRVSDISCVVELLKLPLKDSLKVFRQYILVSEDSKL